MYGPSATCFSRARPSKYLVGETEANREARENGLAGREQLPTRGSDGRENMTRLECYAWKRSDLSGEAGDNQTTRLDSTRLCHVAAILREHGHFAVNKKAKVQGWWCYKSLH
jgi:hypothetical protein